MTCAELNNVTVSVAMITYNHKDFIAQAIESVLMQQTDFTVELIIGEDCSTDGTREIVTEYAQRYPDRIRPLLHEHNCGLQGKNNFVATLTACRGKYVAIIEGDDYWTDPHKLKRQLEFLMAHPECTICAHVAQVVDEMRRPICEIPEHKYRQEISTLENLLQYNYIPTCSAMFRRGLFGKFPEWYFSILQGDWPLHVLNAQYGNIGFMNDVMSSYRLHSNGVWSSSSVTKRLEAIIHAYRDLDEHLKHKYHSLIQRMIWKYQYDLALSYENTHDITNARCCIKACLIPNMINRDVSRRKLVATWLRLFTPSIYHFMQSIKSAIWQY